jgi:hypothetical protein
MPVGAWELEYGCTTIADPNRVAQYVANAQNPNYCTNGINSLAPYPLKWTTLRVNCGCPATNWFSDTPGVDPTARIPYTSPALDFAPWYTPDHPESAHFWGWMVERVEDVATAPITRAVTERVSSFGGSVLGPLRKRGRAMRFTLIGFGAYEAAMDYGYRWLSDNLTTEGAACELCDMTFRIACPELGAHPTYTEWDQGRWTFKDVGIIDGPTYEDPPNPDARGSIRRVSFTMVASIPYGFKCPESVLQNMTWIPQLWSATSAIPFARWDLSSQPSTLPNEIVGKPEWNLTFSLTDVNSGCGGFSEAWYDVTPGTVAGEDSYGGTDLCNGKMVFTAQLPDISTAPYICNWSQGGDTSFMFGASLTVCAANDWSASLFLGRLNGLGNYSYYDLSLGGPAHTLPTTSISLELDMNSGAGAVYFDGVLVPAIPVNFFSDIVGTPAPCALPIIPTTAAVANLNYSSKPGFTMELARKADCPPLDWICDANSGRTCVSATSDYITGDTTMVIEVHVGPADVNNLTISVTPDPYGYVCGTAPPHYVAPDPCYQLVIPHLPANSILRYDGTLSSVTIKLPGHDYVDASPYLNTDLGPATFPSITSGQFCVCIGSERCSWNSDGSWVNVWLVHRELGI